MGGQDQAGLGADSTWAGSEPAETCAGIPCPSRPHVASACQPAFHIPHPHPTSPAPSLAKADPMGYIPSFCQDCLTVLAFLLLL